MFYLVKTQCNWSYKKGQSTPAPMSPIFKNAVLILLVHPAQKTWFGGNCIHYFLAHTMISSYSGTFLTSFKLLPFLPSATIYLGLFTSSLYYFPCFLSWFLCCFWTDFLQFHSRHSLQVKVPWCMSFLLSLPLPTITHQPMVKGLLRITQKLLPCWGWISNL